MFLYTDEEIKKDIVNKNLRLNDYCFIDDITKINDHELDLNKSIYLRNIPPHHVICNNNVSIMVEYIKSLGYDLDLFLKQHTNYSLQHLNDYSRWVSFEDYIELFDLLTAYIGIKNPRYYEVIGKFGCEKEQHFINLIQFMANKFITVLTTYELVPVFNRNFDYDIAIQHILTKKTGKKRYKIILITKAFENFKDKIPFWNIFWLNGVLTALPRRKGYDYALATIPYYYSNLVQVLTGDYGYLDLKVVELDNKLYVNGQQYARKVIVKKEIIRPAVTFKNWLQGYLNLGFRKKNNQDKDKHIKVYSTEPFPLDSVSKEELDELIARQEGCVCYQVIKDLIDEKEGLILKEGELYDLPYTRLEYEIDLTKKPQPVQALHIKKNKKSLLEHLEKLRLQVLELEKTKQIAYTEAKAAQAAKQVIEELNLTLEQKVKKRTQQLEEAKSKLEQMLQLKTDLFINIAHETKTPLTLINNYLDMYIEKYGITEELKIIKQNMTKLQNDMVNFLDTEKLIKGQIHYDHNQVFNFAVLLKEKILLFNAVAIKKGITLTAQLEEDIYIKADPSAIDKIINNLLDNAIKFTSPGGKIQISLNQTGDNIQFSVVDDGIGISAEQQKNIFSPYYQIARPKKNIQGIGMGLFITSKIVETLHGKIELQSALNHGSHFKIILPGAAKETCTLTPGALSYSQPCEMLPYYELKEGPKHMYRSNILLVEDNTHLLFYLQTHLEQKYNVYIASNGQTALDKLSTIAKPQLIISDIMMDEMDGISFVRELSKTEAYQDIPLIFLTAKSSTEAKVLGLTSGAIDYISKPFSIIELVSKIDSILENKKIKNFIAERDKFATIGKFMMGITHEILNPLGGIHAPLENLQNYINNNSACAHNSVKGYFERIFDNIKRIEDIIKTFRLLFTEKKLLIEPINLEEIIQSVEKLFDHKMRDHISFDYKVDKDLIINSDQTALTHILLNLISNAIDAIEVKGSINILAKKNNEGLLLKVSDTGCGISQANLKSIFDPFYTTKEVGYGMGLGLFIVKELVTKLGWQIEAQSQIDRGTEFIIHTKSKI